MAEMTRVEAAAVLDAMIFGTYPDDDITIEKIEMEAVRFAIAALRSPWVKTSDRLPTDADATCGYGNVLAYYTWNENLTLVSVQGVCNYPDKFPWWMPIPPLPEVEG